jgi:hypothetical protein
MLSGKFIVSEPDANGNVRVDRNCTLCTKDSFVENVPAKRLELWQAGEYPQRAFPNMSAADREILLSGTHDECWQKAFPPDDEGDEGVPKGLPPEYYI